MAEYELPKEETRKEYRSIKSLNGRDKKNNPFTNFTTFNATPEPGYVNPKDLSTELKKLMLLEED